MVRGIIIRSLSEFYTVDLGNETVVCKARGKFKARNFSPLVGDAVEIERTAEGKGIINSIEPRKNYFVRPPLANIDILVMVVSHTPPITDPFLIDKMAVISEISNCEFLICINKTDLSSEKNLQNIYSKTKYNTVSVSARTGEGMECLFSHLQGKTAALTGNSGVGKSSLMNSLLPELHLETGELSDKYGRGKHTTRHTELFRINDSTYLADTAGFSSFDISQVSKIKKGDLKDYFPEFSEREDFCRYMDCVHLKEPGCAVRQAVVNGEIAASRYDSYIKIYDSISKSNDWEKS